MQFLIVFAGIFVSRAMIWVFIGYFVDQYRRQRTFLYLLVCNVIGGIDACEVLQVFKH